MTSAPPSRDKLLGEGDFLSWSSLLTDTEHQALMRQRRFLVEKAQPALAEHWDQGLTPHVLREEYVREGLVRPAELPAGEDLRPLFVGVRNAELSRMDGSLAILIGGQIGMFNTVMRVGLPEQEYANLRPEIEEFRVTGCFALTEPEHGSDVAGGLSTSAERRGDTWVLRGEKKWIGNAELSQVLLVAAVDTADAQVKVFRVPADAPGVDIERMTGKTSLRMVGNARIRLHEVEVAEEMRLPRINSFADLNRAFRQLRPDVVWNAVGLQAGVYEHTLAYAREREQFGRPIAGFQLVQEKLARMLGNLNASLGVAVRLAQREEETGAPVSQAEAALAKSWVTRQMRETAALGREILGGNGILLEHHVARFHADAESLYTFEGTYEINSLIVGRAVTGRSAFTT
ncbi:acyl-CoA dehydrogenase family protein [Nesterenkonia flava]|uniref:Acyl-CoA dehydrogenase family protein n=1 Tax=Nesterenkonia flava TaxID=469799 RepID=A0ABU1FPG4_9MICC|nr:acyl-CoA dehydrogenase family protein [Nesterenkonia flava]MDR5710534.1 acyl-CoA dehydrogenase family protein [Nesterenkonia flava]